jgi:hypothetical protein
MLVVRCPPVTTLRLYRSLLEVVYADRTPGRTGTEVIVSDASMPV